MPDYRYPALQRVEEDLARNDLCKARDRLQGVLVSHPEDLQIRRQLAELYHRIGMPIQAGLYAYLSPDLPEELQADVDCFLKECAYKPDVVYQRLKIKLNPSEFEPSQERDKLMELANEVKNKRLIRPITENGKTEFANVKSKSSSNLLGIGCMIGLITIALLAFYGFATPVESVIN